LRRPAAPRLAVRRGADAGPSARPSYGPCPEACQCDAALPGPPPERPGADNRRAPGTAAPRRRAGSGSGTPPTRRWGPGSSRARPDAW